MNEGRTTAIFAAVAAVSFGLALWSKPEAISDENDLKKERTGQPVFAKFEDPGEAAILQVIKYDEELGQLERFEVAKDKTSSMWKLPSYDDYPADAAEQVRDATTPLISLPIIDVPSLDRGDHSLYGVVNPDEEGLTVGESGVGMLVRVTDAANQVLAELIVGKEVDGAEGQRYVRIPSEDAVYVVELDPTVFTTDFQEWINQELLEVRSFDISSVGLRDYAIVPTQNGYGMSRNFDADLNFDSASNKWSLERLVTYESGKANTEELADGQSVNEQSLNDLRNAVQDLQIVGVRRKPKGLAADLKADKSLMENQESLQSLVGQGFIPQDGPEGTEIFATGGETLVGTQAGVKYLLRFGEVVAKLGDTDEDESGLRRYLLVSATLDNAKFPPPELEPLPESVEEMLELQKAEQAEDQPATTSEESQSSTADADDTTTEDSAGDEEAAAVEKPPAPKKAQDSSPAEEASENGASENGASEDGASEDGASEDGASDDESELSLDDVEQDASADTAEPPAEDEQDGTDNSPGEVAADDAQETQDAVANEDEASAAEADAAAAANAEAADKPQKTEEELKEELEFVRETIAKENQRKIDDRNEKLDAARKRVQELNARFADWYYVVSDNVYKKLKITKDQLIKTAGEGDENADSGEPAFGTPGIGPPGFSIPGLGN